MTHFQLHNATSELPSQGKGPLSTQPGPGCGMVSEVLSPGLLDQEGGDPLQRQSAQGGVNSASRIPYTCLQDLSLGALAALPVPDQSPRALLFMILIILRSVVPTTHSLASCSHF